MKNIIQSPPLADAIDLGMGNPDLELLPVDALQRASERAFAKGMRASLQYGKEAGNGYFREALADFLSASFNAPVNGASLFVSNGVSSALDMLAGLLTRPGDTIIVETPTYFIAPSIFADRGLQVISAPMDAEGLNTEALEEILEREKPKLFYTIPTFQNPSGRTLSLARREKLIELAEKHDFVIVADEVYHLLPYFATPPKAFALFSEETERVVSVNSFSKILAPGLRLGWIQAHTNILKKLSSLGVIDSGGGLNPFTSAIVHELVANGDLGKNIALLQETYHLRLKALDAALKEFLPQAEYTTPKGGFFYWVRIPGVDNGELRKKAKDFKVDIRQGALFSAGKGMGEYMRLCFAYYGEEELREGIKRLADCVRG